MRRDEYDKWLMEYALCREVGMHTRTFQEAEAKLYREGLRLLKKDEELRQIPRQEFALVQVFADRWSVTRESASRRLSKLYYAGQAERMLCKERSRIGRPRWLYKVL